MVRVADFVISFLEQQGVKDIFTVSGGGSIFLDDALTLNKNVKYYCCHHEQAVAMAAEAYARVKRDLGVSLVTTGPGGTNAITGVACSWMDSVPHLIISGQTFRNQTIGNTGLRQLGVQEINIVDIVKPITKYAVMVADAKSIEYYLQKAIFLAKSGRPGPVWVDVPADIQMAPLPEHLEEFNPAEFDEAINFYQPRYDKDLAEKVSMVVKLLQQAKRPLFHIGQGVTMAGAASLFFSLAEKYNIPFVTARNANDLVNSDHQLFAGRPGTFAQRYANFAVQNADLYIALGTRLSLPQTGYNSKDFARNAVKVMVDIDRAELYKDTLDIDIKIHHDAKMFLEELQLQLELASFPKKNFGPWVEYCQNWKRKYPVVLPSYAQNKKGINSYYFIDMLSEILRTDTIVVTDMGFAFQTTHQAFKIKSGQRLVTNCGLAPMGWGLPAAVGACIANDKKDVICIVGEGGLQMNLQELATVMHYQLPIKIFVYNNDGYLTIKQTQEYGFQGRLMGCNKETGLSFPDYQMIAEAHKLKTFRLDAQDDLKEKVEKILNLEGPVFCELMMEPDQAQVPKFLNRKTPEGKTIPTAFEDLYPYLNKEEFEENMICQKDEKPTLRERFLTGNYSK